MPDTKLTIFNSPELVKHQQEAIQNFISGTTPKKEIKQRPGRGGGKDIDYVTIAYMTRQASLLTGGRWSHKVISKRSLPDFQGAIERIKASKVEQWSKDDVIDMIKRMIRDIPKEVICEVEVTLYDNNGIPYTHTATGSKKVVYYSGGAEAGQPISLGDDEKAAESDAIKKALAYWGIANDVYGSENKEMEAYQE